MSTSILLIYIFFGSVAFAYMTYGKSQRKAVALFSGIGLAVLPYFGLDMWLMIGCLTTYNVFTFFTTHIKCF